MRKETAKIKKIVFNIDAKMTLPELVKAGYHRREVKALFTELHDKKLGYMIDGVRGGNPMTFFASPCCPKTYELDFKVYRFRKTVEEKTNFIVENSIVNDVITTTIASCKNLDVEIIPESDNNGYVIGFQENKAVLVRVDNGGYSSIEDAVNVVLNKFDSFSTFNSRSMSRVQQIASTLRGIGFVQL